MYKKTIVMTVVMTVFLNLFTFNAVVKGNETISAAQYFNDVEGHWCYKIIDDFYKSGAIKGYYQNGKNLFKPDALITRAEFSAILAKYLNIEALEGYIEIDFSDLEENSWYKSSVDLIAAKGVVKGYNDGTFRPDSLIRRNEITAMSAAFVRKNEEDMDITYDVCFPDVKKGDWFFDDISQLKEKDIAHGYPDGYFRPERNATRAEAIKLLYNLKTKVVTPIPDPTSTITNTPTPTSIPTPTSTPRIVYIPTAIPTNTPVPPKLDLVARSVDVSSMEVDSLSLATKGMVSAEVYNAGPDNLNINVETVFFEDTNINGKFDNDDLVIGKTTLSDVGKGVSKRVSVEVKGATTFKDNLVYVFVDSTYKIDEPDEKNNIIHSKSNCEFKPPVGSFNPVVEWGWNSSKVLPDTLNVMMTPVIMDVDGDDIPEIIFGSTSSRTGEYVEKGVLRAIHGDTGEELFTVTDEKYYINTASSIAAGDIDNDSRPEIIACDITGKKLIAFEHDGSFKWRTEELGTINWGAPSICDIDNDGTPEIIIGNQIINNDGSIRKTGSAGKAFGAVGPLSFAADVNMDGIPEILCGNTLYDNKGEIIWHNTTLTDGQNGVGNFDDDIKAEIVMVCGGRVWLLEDDGAIKWGPVALPGGGSGGAPTVADFDNDGQVEIGVAGASMYTVFEGDGGVLWSSPTRDQSSNVTGSSVFDFDGDGSFEVVYSDELTLRIYSGKDGKVLYQIPMSSATWYEYPVIADVDNDGNAEIVAVANDNGNLGPQRGIYVIGDANDTWVNTGKVWNQHAFSITNVNNDGTIPQSPQTNWTLYNNFRCNQSMDALACADISISFPRFYKDGEHNILKVRIGNSGSIILPKNLKVSFYSGDSTQKTLIGKVNINKGLNPGEYVDIELGLGKDLLGKNSFIIVADDNGSSNGMVREINEVNNMLLVEHDFGPDVTATPEPEVTPDLGTTLDPRTTTNPETTPGTIVDPPNTPAPGTATKPGSEIQINNISPEEGSELIKNGDVVIIDVRTSVEYSQGHLQKALNIDIRSENFNTLINDLDKSKKYLVYCASGKRSYNASTIMKELGFEKIYNLTGGITEWNSQGYEIVIE